ncbi:hypothetical protein O181_076522 [Austropuccinia psidii MF-1]|uniref:Reverse transcriptase domain-containing protein n=1 Tax=Austropuccinia psidii MF-1 TaxID=1389203 RepID=A0A9Q3FH06_9BASI|nr:hypothetical protein [Austropuccinia psidii MF-1]
MPSNRSGASYNPSRSSEKGYRRDYGRRQSVTEGQGSKKAINIIKEDNKKSLDDIANSFNGVKTYTIALKKCFDTSKEEVSELTMEFNQVTCDNTRKTELWQELKYKEEMYKIEVIDSIQSFQHEFRNSKRCSTSKMNDIQHLLHNLPRMYTPMNQNKAKRTSDLHALNLENLHLKNGFSTSFHNLEPLMSQSPLKEVPKHKEWHHFSAHRWYIKLRQAHGHQIWTWWKTQIINKRTNDACRFKVEKAFESAKFNSENDKALLRFCQQKDRLTALYPDMSEFVIPRKILRQCGGDLENTIKSRTTEKSSEEDIINIMEDVITRSMIGFSRVNLKTRFNTPWKDYVDKNPKGNYNNMKYKSKDLIKKCHIGQSTTNLANYCPKKGKINEIDIEKEPDVERDYVNEANSDDKSSIFSEYSKDIENINVTFDIMECHSQFPQLRNCQLDLSKIQDAQLMKTKPNRKKGYTAENSCITEVVIDKKPTKVLVDPGGFCSCVGKYFLKNCVPNFEDQSLPIDGTKLNSKSDPMKALGIFEITVIFPHIYGNLRITVEFAVMENCTSTHFILGNDHLIMYGIDLHNNKDRYFTIGDYKCQKYAFLPFGRKIKENELSTLLYDHKEAFESDKKTLGEIVDYEADINLNIERTYNPLLRIPAYPGSPKSRKALELHIKELLDLGVIRKVGHNEEVEITKPLIVSWNNGKLRMVGDLRALIT